LSAQTQAGLETSSTRSPFDVRCTSWVFTQVCHNKPEILAGGALGADSLVYITKLKNTPDFEYGIFYLKRELNIVPSILISHPRLVNNIDIGEQVRIRHHISE
jgi:hypothetical protein